MIKQVCMGFLIFLLGLNALPTGHAEAAIQSKSLLQGKTITIDPGHGGSDTGAIGPDDVREKEVTLAIAQDLRRFLVNAGAKVVMTRTTDQDVAYIGAPDKVELQSRLDVANRVRSDLFVSIHANSFDGFAGGTTTYYFGSSDSSLLAQDVQQNMVKQMQLFDRGFQEQDYYVLKNSAMPAVLAEVAFLSNPLEEKMLTTDSFQQKAAQGIYNGIVQFYQSK